MAVQIPEVKRMNPVEDTSVGRLDSRNLPDPVPSMERTSSALLGFGKEAMTVGERFEREAIDTEKTKASTELETFFDEKMHGKQGTVDQPGERGIRNSDGDPAELYSGLDDQLAEKFKSLTSNEKYDPRMTKEVTKHLTDTMNRLHLKKTLEYGDQQSKYDNKVSEAQIDLEKGNLLSASARINADDPSTVPMFDGTVGRIRDLIIKNGIKTGSVIPTDDDKKANALYVAEDGKPNKVILNPVVQDKLSKTLGEGIGNAIENLINSGNTEGAQLLKEKYNDYLGMEKRKGLVKDLEAAAIKKESYQTAATLKNKTPDQIDSLLSDKKPEVRAKTLEILDDEQRRLDNMQKRSDKTNYDYVAKKLLAIQNSNDPIQSNVDLENNADYALASKKIKDPKLLMGLKNIVLAPKDTPESVREKWQNVVAGTDPEISLVGMKPEDLSVYTSSMNKADRNRANVLWQRFNDPETGTETSQRYKLADKALQSHLLAVNYLTKDQFGKLPQDEESKLTFARDDMHKYLDARGNLPMSPKEIDEFTRSYSVSKMKGEAFKPPEVSKFNGNKNSPPAAGNTQTPSKNAMYYVKLWQSKNPGKQIPILTSPDFQKFIKENK